MIACGGSIHLRSEGGFKDMTLLCTTCLEVVRSVQSSIHRFESGLPFINAEIKVINVRSK